MAASLNSGDFGNVFVVKKNVLLRMMFYLEQHLFQKDIA